MRFRLRILALPVAAVAAGLGGCNAKTESQPNPEFKAPEIPAGNRSGPAPNPADHKPPGK
jgi:hypothetical protein